ncbi:MAG: ornithine carbamoyltransferase [Dehalococcoidales bacterium]|nr:ornithine carbamoyltransferase [Dehalococcoidales bacterium]
MKGRDLLSISDLHAADIRRLITGAIALKNGGWTSQLGEKTLALLFEKPSLRTRVSFEVAMRQLGGQCIYLSPAEVGLGQREAVADVARVLSSYVDIITIRTFSHRTLEEFARHSRVPVINALSDAEHPCQALSDLMTVYEKKGKLEGLVITFVGDGNNVSTSLMLAAALSGMHFRIASPPGYAVKNEFKDLATSYARANGGSVIFTEDPHEAVRGADIVYTDVWTSMGQEAEAAKRRRDFAAYQVNGRLFSLARADAIFMHNLPAHRGEEVTDEVIDGPRSVVFEQSENKMHLLKALLLEMLGGEKTP